MDEEAKDAIDYLRACALACIFRGSVWEADTCMMAVADIERLTAEVAALKAEVERLTPREMTSSEAADVLDARRHDGLRWRAEKHEDGSCIVASNDDHGANWFRASEAVYIAQGLERDAKGGG